MIVPSSNIYLLKTPFELESRNNLTFANSTTQYNYFMSLPKINIDDATYQRKDGVIRYPGLIDNIMSYNYCMYQNENFSDKWFYAYITNMEYANENMTIISIETDVFQTYQFDVIYKPSFIEREHVNNDTVGLHTIPEDLETGEYICNSHIIDDKFDDVANDLVYILSCSVDLGEYIQDPNAYDSDNPIPPSPIRKYNGIVSGTTYYPAPNAQTIKTYLEGLTLCGQIDAVNGLFMTPALLIGTLQSDFSVEERNTPITYTNSISKQTTLNGYSPVNKKLLCYPFNYLLVSNNNGNSSVMHYEDFSESCTFKIDMAITPGCSIRMKPTNYKGIAEADEYGINMGKLPICSYPVDMYTNWLTQNSINVGGHLLTSDDINIGVSGTNMLINTVSSGLQRDIGGALSGLVNGMGGIANSMITKKQHELIPPEARGNLNSGDVVTSSGKNNFHFYKMSIREEYARIIDNFFSMYGYKVNDVKVPNITGRVNWNYVKTIGANIIGDIPGEDLLKFRSLFDNGITLWHNPNTYLDYSQNNGII